MKEYLSVKQLCEEIGYARQSIYNMISNNIFVVNVHYIKPSRKKIIFIGKEIEKWMHDESAVNAASKIDYSKSRINI